MEFLLLGIVALVVIVFVVSKFGKSSDAEKEEVKEVPAECCGAHEICEVELRKLSKKIVYFDDEELDKYQNRGELEYNDNEIEEFRDILYTLKQEEIADWLHSLELRKVYLPVELKSEVIALLND